MIVRFGDYVLDTKGKVNRDDNPYDYYIAGDHMDSEDLELHRRGEFATDDVGPAFVRLFKPGQVLYGSRRTYLKKVAVADFEGVTANTTFVFETKNSEILSQDILPFIMLSEKFTNYSIVKSKGSTNPYVLFSDLADYEFELPDIETQRKLAELLWSMEYTKRAYRSLIQQTDELVKSQFIEMFGTIKEPRYEVSTILDECTLKSGTTFASDLELEEGEVLYSKVSDMNLPGNEVYIRSSKQYVSEATAGKTKIPKGAVIFPKRGAAIGTNKKRILIQDTCVDLNTMGVIPGSRLLTEYLYGYFLGFDLMSIADGSTIPQLNNRQIGPLEIIVPPIEEQKKYISLFMQSDKSKFELQKSLDELTAMQKKIIEQNLT